MAQQTDPTPQNDQEQGNVAGEQTEHPGGSSRHKSEVRVLGQDQSDWSNSLNEEVAAHRTNDVPEQGQDQDDSASPHDLDLGGASRRESEDRVLGQDQSDWSNSLNEEVTAHRTNDVPEQGHDQDELTSPHDVDLGGTRRRESEDRVLGQDQSDRSNQQGSNS